MGEDAKAFIVGTIGAVLIVGMLVGGMASCSISDQRAQTDRQGACVSSGGSWVIQRGTNYTFGCEQP